jgi:hypothetical protein
MDTPNSFLVNPLRPVSFQPTRKGREPLGPRFARQGIDIQRLVTADDGDEAIAAVIQAEYDALSTDERQDRARLDHIFDWQFVTDPLYGIPPELLVSRRAARDEVMRAMTRQWEALSQQATTTRPESVKAPLLLRRLRARADRPLRLTPIEEAIANRHLPPRILLLAWRQSRIGQAVAKLIRPLAKLGIRDCAETGLERGFVQRRPILLGADQPLHHPDIAAGPRQHGGQQQHREAAKRRIPTDEGHRGQDRQIARDDAIERLENGDQRPDQRRREDPDWRQSRANPPKKNPSRHPRPSPCG